MQIKTSCCTPRTDTVSMSIISQKKQKNLFNEKLFLNIIIKNLLNIAIINIFLSILRIQIVVFIYLETSCAQNGMTAVIRSTVCCSGRHTEAQWAQVSGNKMLSSMDTSSICYLGQDLSMMVKTRVLQI